MLKGWTRFESFQIVSISSAVRVGLSMGLLMFSLVIHKAISLIDRISYEAWLTNACECRYSWSSNQKKLITRNEVKSS
jgi:hypothetical protein